MDNVNRPPHHIPKCATCNHFASCVIQKHLTEMALILWNINREEEKTINKPKGEWIEMYRNGFGNMIYMCSRCNFHATKSNFCPNCGADMRGENNE